MSVSPHLDPTPSRQEKTRARQARILEHLEASDFIGVKALSREFGLTEMSIRRDLNAMESSGLLTRVHGGAARPRAVQPSRTYAAGTQRNAAAKARIARAAADRIPPGSSVFCYSGSTVARTVASLGPDVRRSLTIVTNSLPVIADVNTWDDPHLVAIGGTYLPAYMAFVGPQSIRALEELSADVAVLGCDGLSIDAGLTTPHQLVAQVGATLVARARMTIVVADSSKVGRRGFTPICSMDAVDLLVTDVDADHAEIAALTASGLAVDLV